MTVTWLPSVFVTCTSYAAAAFELSFSVVAASAVPPTFATAAAFAFVATSPVSGVSPERGPLGFAVVVVVAIEVPVVVPAPRATAAPTSAHTASAAAAPIRVRLIFMLTRNQPHLWKCWDRPESSAHSRHTAHTRLRRRQSREPERRPRPQGETVNIDDRVKLAAPVAAAALLVGGGAVFAIDHGSGSSASAASNGPTAFGGPGGGVAGEQRLQGTITAKTDA